MLTSPCRMLHLSSARVPWDYPSILPTLLKTCLVVARIEIFLVQRLKQSDPRRLVGIQLPALTVLV